MIETRKALSKEGTKIVSVLWLDKCRELETKVDEQPFLIDISSSLKVQKVNTFFIFFFFLLQTKQTA